MRVLFVTHAPRDPLAAVYRCLQIRADALERRGHQAVILTPTDLRCSTKLSRRYQSVTYAMAVQRWLRRRRFDLVVFHSWSGWAFNLARDRERAPRTLTQFHGVEPLYYKKVKAELERIGRQLPLRHRVAQERLMPLLLRLSCRRSDFVACLNSEELQFLQAEGYAGAGRACVLPNTVDQAFFGIDPAGWDGRRITFVGQWLEAKGSHVLTEAWVELARARPRLQLSCLGTRAARESVEASIPAELRARVTVAAELDAEAIRAGLAATDVFVLPSISEGSSLALLEAMAAGCAIVTTHVGAAPDLLRHDISALLVPPGDAAALSAAISRVLEDPGLARRLGAAARAAARPFDWRVQEAEYVRFVERIVR